MALHRGHDAREVALGLVRQDLFDPDEVRCGHLSPVDKLLGRVGVFREDASVAPVLPLQVDLHFAE